MNGQGASPTLPETRCQLKEREESKPILRCQKADESKLKLPTSNNNIFIMSRADYWKSQVRKFCDFCKCWIADNKPSVQFHESGKRHKENVAKRIAEITKKSTKAHKAELEYKDDIKTMEEAALKAYMKDVETSRDYTAQKILEAQRKKEEEKEAEKNTEDVPPEETSTQVVEEESPAEKEWYEAKSDEGHTYYWNVTTSESRWEPPEEGYKSIEEQEEETKVKRKKEQIEKQKVKEAKKQRKEEERARKEREEMKKRKVKDDVEKPQSSKSDNSNIIFGPAPKPDPYGSWTTVEKVVEQPLDLELPVHEYIPIQVPEYTEPEIKFKEKTITQLDDNNEGISGFKKRKLNAGAKRGNMRQRLDDD